MSERDKLRKVFVQMGSTLHYLRCRLDAVQTLTLLLAKESGMDHEALVREIDRQAAEQHEKLLLAVGDTSPDLAEIADLLGILPKKEEKDGEGA